MAGASGQTQSPFSSGGNAEGRIPVAIKNSKISGKSDNPTGQGMGRGEEKSSLSEF